MGRAPMGRRKLLAWGGAAAFSTGIGALAFWPSETERSGYPLAGRLAGKHEPLWNVAPEALRAATNEDASRLERLLLALERGIANVEKLDARLGRAQAGELSGAERERIREQWFQFFEPVLAIDELKSRYKAWYGLDYRNQTRLHARAFALAFAGLCGQVDAGLRLLATLKDKTLLPVLFDEAMPAVGLPARTFSGLRAKLGRARDLFYVSFGDEWYERWIERELAADEEFGKLKRLLEGLRQNARRRVLTPTSHGVANKVETLKSEAFERWFPLQKGLAEWAGDTRFARSTRRLIDDAKLALFSAALAPGDIILERRNWYLSNVGLPGFWPHAALHLGTQRQILGAFAELAEVKSAFGDLNAHFQKTAPKAWATLGERDAEGHERSIIEAVSEGVVTASVEHSCAADYVAALRPELGAVARVRAIERALSFWGRPYDFNFDFLTDDQLVCSELVVKAYEAPPPGEKSLDVPYVELLGRRAVPPTEIVRAFRAGLGKPDAQLKFVYFLDGREEQRAAAIADAEALAHSCDRPKWDIVQP
jgi:hypothetical protein